MPFDARADAFVPAQRFDVCPQLGRGQAGEWRRSVATRRAGLPEVGLESLEAGFAAALVRGQQDDAVGQPQPRHAGAQRLDVSVLGKQGVAGQILPAGIGYPQQHAAQPVAARRHLAGDQA